MSIPGKDDEMIYAKNFSGTKVYGFKIFACAKRGCDRINPDWYAFGTADGKTYCLHHIPLRSRIKLWWKWKKER